MEIPDIVPHPGLKLREDFKASGLKLSHLAKVAGYKNPTTITHVIKSGHIPVRVAYWLEKLGVGKAVEWLCLSMAWQLQLFQLQQLSPKP